MTTGASSSACARCHLAAVASVSSRRRVSPPRRRWADPRSSRVGARVAVASSSGDGAPLEAWGRPGEYRRLGGSDLFVSDAFLSASAWSSSHDERDALEQLSVANDAGVNLVDLPPHDDDARVSPDQRVGRWFRLAHKRREDLLLAAAVDPLARRRAPPDTPRDAARSLARDVESILIRAELDHVDLVQLRWHTGHPDDAHDACRLDPRDPHVEACLEALARLVREGKARHVGVDHDDEWGVCEHRRFDRLARLAQAPPIVAVRNARNLLARGAFEEDLARACAPRVGGVGLLASAPLAWGALRGDERPGDAKSFSTVASGGGPRPAYAATATANAKGSRSVEGIVDGFPERVLFFNGGREGTRAAAAAAAEVASAFGATTTELAYAFARSGGFAASVAVGGEDADRLRANLDAFRADVPKECVEEAVAAVERVAAGTRTREER